MRERWNVPFPSNITKSCRIVGKKCHPSIVAVNIRARSKELVQRYGTPGLPSTGDTRKLILANLHEATLYLGDNLDSSRSFLNSSLANNSLFFFSLYSSLILVLTNCSNIFPRKRNKIQHLLAKSLWYWCSTKGLSIMGTANLICPQYWLTCTWLTLLPAALTVCSHKISSWKKA